MILPSPDPDPTMIDAWDRPLTHSEEATVDAARRTAFLLYEGRVTPHRSCGICLAETFGVPTRPYQALRKGGLTGLGACGALVGGRLLLGEVLGDPDPTGAVTPTLLQAMHFYDARAPQRLSRGRIQDSWICNDLTGQFDDFRGPERASFCAALATEVAGLVAETLLRAGHDVQVLDADALG